MQRIEQKVGQEYRSASKEKEFKELQGRLRSLEEGFLVEKPQLKFDGSSVLPFGGHRSAMENFVQAARGSFGY